MVDKQKVIIILLIVAIVFSVVSAAITLSVSDFEPAQPSSKVVVYSGNPKLGNPNGGVNLYIQPGAGE